MSGKEDNSMCERIISDVNSILQSDNTLTEFSVIPTAQNDTNRSPVLHEQHNLALESWCIKHVYRYAQTTLLNQKLALYNNRLTPSELTALTKYLNVALLCLPEVTTLWNMRRDLYAKGVNTTEFELQFSMLALSFKPKCLEAFAYRRWILKRSLDEWVDRGYAGDFLNQWMLLVRQELDLLATIGDKLHNNYHVWTHRSWLLQMGFPTHVITDMLEQELKFTLDWTGKHVSEHASFQYRQVVLRKCKGVPRRLGFSFLSTFNSYLDEDHDVYKNVIVKLLSRDLSETMEHSLHYVLSSKVSYFCILLVELVFYCRDLNKLFPNHETIWYHRRFVLHSLISLLYGGYGVHIDDNSHIPVTMKEGKDLPKDTNQKKASYGLMRAKSNYYYQLIVRLEQESMAEFSNDSKQSQVQRELARKHLLWLRNILQIAL